MIRPFGWNEFLFILTAVQWTLALSAIAFFGGGIGGLTIALMRTSSMKLLRGITTAYIRLFQGTPLLTEQEAAATLQDFMTRKRQAEAERNRAEGEAFLAENRKQKGVITTASGLQYMVLREGSGPRPAPTDTVRVNYEGRLLDGTVFDSSYQRGQPAEFPLTAVIAGWTEGVALMPVGAKYRFWIPSDLAYGANGAPGGKIGPNATLTFDVELLGIAP